MESVPLAGPEFAALAAELLAAGRALRFRARGGSMRPAIRDGDVVHVQPVRAVTIHRGDVVLVRKDDGRLLVHRVVAIRREPRGSRTYVIKGDALACLDGSVPQERVLGRVTSVERGGTRIELGRALPRIVGLLWSRLVRFSRWLYRRAFWSLSVTLCLALLALGAVAGLVSASSDGAVVGTALPSYPPSLSLSISNGLAPLVGQTPGVRLLSFSGRRLVLELLTPSFGTERGFTHAGPCTRLTVDGYGSTDLAGHPEVPVQGAMAGIPPQADVTLTVLETESELLPAQYDICPVPSPIVEMDLSGELGYGGSERIRDAQAYASEGPFPPAAAELVSTGYVRSQRVAQVRFHPFQYAPASGELWHHRRIRVLLAFGQADSAPEVGGAAHLAAAGWDEGSFEGLLRRALVNYADARRWRARPPTAGRADAGSRAVTTPLYKVTVETAGLYQVTYADLQATGIDPSAVDPDTFHLANRGQEVAIHIEGGGDGAFDPGDAILFYGQEISTQYTNKNAYWLTWDSFPGIRMPVADGTPTGAGTVPAHFLTTRQVEQDRFYQSRYPNQDDDYWYWNYIYKGVYDSLAYTTSLAHVATAPLSATVRGYFQGYSADPQHGAAVSLNGHRIYTATWSSGEGHPFEVDVPQSYLLEGANTITVTGGVGNVRDLFFIDGFEIDYHATYATDDDLLFFAGNAGTWEYAVSGFSTDTVEVLDVTVPTRTVRILGATIEPGGGVYTLTFQQAIPEGHRYLALTPAQRDSPSSVEKVTPSNLRSTANAADYIVVTHADFYTDVLPLADHRAAMGLRTMVVDVQEVYDEFGYGIYGPAAIRDFLAYAYANWVPPAPLYVLLVGDGNYDPKDHQGTGEPNYIPPYLAHADPWIGQVAADNRYVAISGDDVLPDMHVGRLPVKTHAEASAVVAKILGYERDPPEGDWNRRVLFVADNPDDAGDFYASSDAVADGYLPAPYAADKVYYGLTHPTPAGAQVAIIEAINSGRLLVNYVGHALYLFWADWDEQLFHVDSVPALANAGRLPFMVPMTCLDGYYTHPSPPGNDISSLGESIVRAPNGGAIASWSPTGFGLTSGHDFLNRGLFEALFLNGVARLGPATTQGKLYLYSNTGGYRDLIDTYTLFGDPALQLNVLKTDVAISKTAHPPGPVQPGDKITYTLTYTNAGPATAFNVVIRDELPDELTDPAVSTSGAAITPRSGSRYVWDVADLAAGEGGTITITAIVSTGLGSTTLTNTATIESTGVERDAADNVDTAEMIVVRDVRHTYLPLVLRDHVHAPDLVVDDVRAASDSVQVVIRNQGTAPIQETFWVDLYVAPHTPPTAVNQVWQDLAEQGLVWGIEGDALSSLGAGGTLTLTVGDDCYWPTLSHVVWPLPPGTSLYAQVDSANEDADYGGVLESHEIGGGTYNNVFGPAYSVAVAAPATAASRLDRQHVPYGGLPPR
jgi:uncharacterized repeat protein (TIGR01451 family)